MKECLIQEARELLHLGSLLELQVRFDLLNPVTIIMCLAEQLLRCIMHYSSVLRNNLST